MPTKSQTNSKRETPENRVELATPKSTYPLLSTKLMRKGEIIDFKVIEFEIFTDKEGNQKPSLVVQNLESKQYMKYVPNKTAQAKIIELGNILYFDECIGKTLTIEVIDTQFQNRPTYGLMVTAVK